MKETVNASIGSQSFTLDRDAYGALGSYLDDIRSRLPEQDTETMFDIEMRLAEIFREKVTSSMMVITLPVVRAAMLQMGAPSDFGEQPAAAETDVEEPEERRRLYRRRDDRSIAGVCSGIAAFFQTDTTLIRLLMLALIFFGGLSIWVYVILWIIIPEEPAGRNDRKEKTDKKR